MQRIVLAFALLTLIGTSKAQFQRAEWETAFYFEDANGDRDTVWIGYDQEASIFPSVIDTIFDENYKKVDTSGFVVYLNDFWIKEDSLIKRRIMSIDTSEPEIRSSVLFNKGKLPVIMYWDSENFNADSMPYNNISPADKAKLWMPNILSSGILKDDTIVNCCNNCRFVSFSDMDYIPQNLECKISDSIVLTTDDNAFYDAEKGIGSFDIILVPLQKKILVGIRELSDIKINIFPNPASEVLNIEYKKDFKEDLTVSIYNTIGSQVDQFVLENNADLLSKDISSLKNGLYIIQFSNHKTSETLRFIKN